MFSELKPVSTGNEYLDVINHINQQMLVYLQNHSNFIKLGADYSSMSKNDAHINLVLHRMHKKFAHVTAEGKDARKALTIKNMVEYDDNGIVDFPQRLRSNLTDPLIKRQLYISRKSLHEIISDYVFSNDNLSFPSGETYRSTGGDISLYAKLKDIKQWCCTPACFDLFAKLAYNSPILKFAARRHFKTFELKTGKKFDNNAMFSKAKAAFNRGWRFAIFKAKLRCVVTFVTGARVETVPKDLNVDRVIICEAFCNMCCQLAIDASIKKLIKKHFGVDLLTSQALHQLLISDNSNSTIDFSNASNSTWLSVVKWFMGGTKIFNDIVSSRSEVVEISTPEGTAYHHLNMLSAMGNGYTFTVMTLLLLCIGRTCDDMCHVFGDDVIVDADVAHQLIPVYEFIGYKVNETKTFLDSTFKESCGGFFCDGYLTSFDFEWCEDVVDAVVLINKVFVLSQNTSLLPLELSALHSQLLEIVPVHLLKGYIPPVDWSTLQVEKRKKQLSIDDQVHRQVAFVASWGSVHSLFNDAFAQPLPSLDDGVWAKPRYVRKKQQGDAKCAKAYKKLKTQLVKDTSVPPTNVRVQPYLQISRKAERYKFRNGRPMEPVDNVSRLLSWFYVFNGRIQAPHLSKSEYKKTWSHTYV